MQALKPGDCVEIIAPASRSTDEQLTDLQELLQSWDLTCIINEAIFGKDLLCANTDEKRFEQLEHALNNPKTKAIICVRGGYGSMRLIPQLSQMKEPSTPKLFVGMSDITALHLYFQQQWRWPTLHASATQSTLSHESLACLKSILFGEVEHIEFTGLTALNTQALSKQTIHSKVIGGNLCLIQASLGTSWQLDSKNRIILIEEVGERAYRVDRMLEHLLQANVLKDAAAIVFGDFQGCEEPDGSTLIQPVLERFAKRCAIPVLQIQGIGHGYVNFPVPFGTDAILELGDAMTLSCKAIASLSYHSPQDI
jgi:muramoyltetrapeptide carboxypeptidase